MTAVANDTGVEVVDLDPRHPLVRLGYPIARRLQKRFARESAAALLRRIGP